MATWRNKSAEMERAKIVEELLGDMERWRRYIGWMEELLRGWRVKKWSENQKGRERNKEEDDGKHEETERKRDKDSNGEGRRKRTEDRSGREKRKEKEDIGVEAGDNGQKVDGRVSGKVQGEGKGDKDRTGESGREEEKVWKSGGT